MQRKSIIIKKVTNHNSAEALQLTLHPGQVDWVPPVAETIERMTSGAGFPFTECFGIYTDRVMIGYFAIAETPGRTDACFLSGFLIDRPYQKQGWGTRALVAIFKMIPTRNPGWASIRITLHPENRAVRSFYWNAGFRPTGEWLEGQAIWEKEIREDSI